MRNHINRRILVFVCVMVVFHQEAQAQDLEITGPAGAGPRQLRLDANPVTAGYQVARRVPPGQFDVDVDIVGLAPSTTCASFVLYFDPAVVSFVGLQGNALMGTDPNPIVLPDTGFVTVYMEQGPEDPCQLSGVSGTGMLAKMRFQSIVAAGQTGFDVLPTVSSWQGPPMCSTLIPAQDYTIAKAVVVIGDATISCLNVNVTNDNASIDPNVASPRNPDCNPALGIGDISLRSAIQVSNAVSGGNHPTFRIPGLNPTIVVGAGLALSDGTGGTFLDGATQPMGMVHVDGPAGVTLTLSSNFNTVKQLAFILGGTGIAISGSSNSIIGSRSGIRATDVVAANGTGIAVTGGTGNSIGGVGATDGNVISGNTADGLVISGGTGTLVRGNKIGTDGFGVLARGNGLRGVFINGISGNTIGASVAGARNIISANGSDGIEIAGLGATNNQVLGNYIGTDVNGNAAIGNVAAGVYINGAPNNSIGAVGTLARNVISGNLADGVEISLPSSNGNSLKNNYIGINVAGTAILANLDNGVFVNGAVNNFIGGGAAGEGNVISGNGLAPGPDHGVLISLATATGNSLKNNFIGLNAAGNAALKNITDGVRIDTGAHGNTIGGIGVSNLISGNGADGVNITGAGTNNNVLYGNGLGVKLGGNTTAGNIGNGLSINAGAKFNQVGGPMLGQDNVMAGNLLSGVKINGAGTDDNHIDHNHIGRNFIGTTLPNLVDGVLISGGAKLNHIEDNHIEGNGSDGVHIIGAGTDQNTILSNTIGAVGRPNGTDGVHIFGGAQQNMITSNNIAANSFNGVIIEGAGTDGNGVLGNQIISNLQNGVRIAGGSGANVIGGEIDLASNGIGSNGQSGVLIDDGFFNTIINNTITGNTNSGVTVLLGIRNQITRNSIFTNQNPAGQPALGIDLFPLGVTPNDAGDGDGGANIGQNFPVLTSAAGSVITGTLNSAPDTQYSIELFSNAQCDPSGNGEGEAYLGSGTAQTDENGDASFSIVVGGAPAPGSLITATATDPNGNTSEFSACFVHVSGPPPCPADINADGIVNSGDLLAVINSWGSCPTPPALCPTDLNGDGIVNSADLLFVINHWGPCI